MTDDKSQSEPKRISVQASVNLGSFFGVGYAEGYPR